VKNVLVIAYFFPPCSASGTYRTLRFVKYLPKFGWDPVILTVKPTVYCEHLPVFPVDASLMQQISVGCTIFRTATLDCLGFLLRLRRLLALRPRTPELQEKRAANSSTVSRWQKLKDCITGSLNTPDPQVGWLLPAVWAGIVNVRKLEVSVVYSTGKPWTAHLIGYCIHRLTGIPWIADFRDPWTQNPWRNIKSKMRQKLEASMEHAVVSHANIVIANTALLREDFVQRYPFLNPSKFLTITNGFDPDDRGLSETIPDNRQTFTLTHVGSLCDTRDPTNLLLAIEQLIMDESISKDCLRVNLIGAMETSLTEFFSRHPVLHYVVNLVPQVPHQEALQYMASSDVLLLIQPKTTTQIPAKLFEYIQAGKPILALTPRDGATGQLVLSDRVGRVVEPDDIESIKQEVRSLCKMHLRQKLSEEFPTSHHHKYNAIHLTQRLAESLDNIAGR